MKENIVNSKSYDFALEIVKLYKKLTGEKREFILSKQLLRSGTAIGAMIRESKFAQSKFDFINKISIGLKEANETLYWLEILHDSDYINENDFNSLHTKCSEIISIMVTIIKTTKSSLEKINS